MKAPVHGHPHGVPGGTIQTGLNRQSCTHTGNCYRAFGIALAVQP